MDNRQNSTNINCKAGHMAIRKASQKSHGRDGIAYYFDVEKCKHCPLK